MKEKNSGSNPDALAALLFLIQRSHQETHKSEVQFLTAAKRKSRKRGKRRKHQSNTQSERNDSTRPRENELEATNIRGVVGEARLLKHLEQVIARGHEDKLVLLPLQIKHVRLENVGPFKLFEAQFSRDQVNLLFGLGGAGKSVVLRSIALCFGIPNKYFQHVGRIGRSGRIDIEVYPFGNHVFMKGREASLKTRLLNAQCVLLDESFDYLVPSKARRLVDALRRMRKQVILASKLSYVKDAVPSKNTVLIPYSLS